MTAEELCDKQTEELARQQELQNRILCCTAAGCLSCGAEVVRQALTAEVEARGLSGKVEIGGTGCMGLCSRGPLVLDSAEQRLYGNVTAADAPAIVSGNTAEQPEPCWASLDLKSRSSRGRTRSCWRIAGASIPKNWRTTSQPAAISRLPRRSRR